MKEARHKRLSTVQFHLHKMLGQAKLNGDGGGGVPRTTVVSKGCVWRLTGSGMRSLSGNGNVPRLCCPTQDHWAIEHLNVTTMK